MMGPTWGLSLLTVIVTALTTLTPTSVSADDHCGSDMSGSLSRLEAKMAKIELENRMARLESRMAQLERDTSRTQVEPEAETDAESCKPVKPDNITCTTQILQCPDVNSNVTKTLENLVEKLADMISALNKNNTSQNNSDSSDSDQENEKSDQPKVCERGMTDSGPESFVLTNNVATGKEIPCDTSTDGGGWLVFMRRADGKESFYRFWAEYRDGFGNLTGDFWLGNEAIHNLTNTNEYEMRIDFVISGEKKFARYESFNLESEENAYTIRVGKYSGTVGQAGNSGLAYSNGAKFSTKDRDYNGYWQGNCAVVCHGAWWYTGCHRANLLGKWGSTGTATQVRWSNGKRWLLPTFIEMKIRRVSSGDSS